MKKTLPLILLTAVIILAQNAQASFGDILHNAFVSAKEGDAKVEYHQEQIDYHEGQLAIRRPEAVKRWATYIKTKEENKISESINKSGAIGKQQSCIFFERQRYPQKCGTRDDVPVVIEHKGFTNDHHRKLMNFAYYIGGMDFLLTLNAENGSRETEKLSYVVGSNGYRDQGLCQLNRKYHLPFIESEDFKDPYKQIRYCYDVYTDAIKKGRIKTTFYGYNHRHERNNGIIYIDDKS